MQKAYTPPPKVPKFHYNTSTTTNSSRCTPTSSLTNRKQSKAVKTRKDSTLSRIITSNITKPRRPLSEVPDINLSHIEDTIALSSTRKHTLKNHQRAELPWEEPKEPIISQNKKGDIQLVRQKVNVLRKEIKESQELDRVRQVNITLRDKNNNQNKEIQALKKQIDLLRKTTAADNKVNAKNKQNEDQCQFEEVQQQSRRLEYMNKYENISSQQQNCQPQSKTTKKKVISQQNHQNKLFSLTKTDQLTLMDQMRAKYQSQLREMWSQVSWLKKKELMVEVLEQQLRNKNQCIDYLRTQVSALQRTSQSLLLAVEELQFKVQQAPRSQSRNSRNWRNSSFHTFSQNPLE